MLTDKIKGFAVTTFCSWLTTHIGALVIHMSEVIALDNVTETSGSVV